MTTLTVKIPETLETELNAVASDRGVSKSELVREAILEHLGRRRERPHVSALTMLEDLVGLVEGPEDLSTNPAYLDDFGK